MISPSVSDGPDSRGPSGGGGSPPKSDRAFVERVLLVGFMGSGKTQVGRALARRLDWAFHDFDQEIESRVGLSIPEIFRRHGEAFFRRVEEEVGREALQERRAVLASGGGWPAVRGRMEGAGSDTLSVWLRVTPEEAVRRARREGSGRPLLAGDDALSRARVLLEEREPFYAKADVVLDSTQTAPEELARQIENLMNEERRGGSQPLSPYK